MALSTNNPQGFIEGDDVIFSVTVGAPRVSGQFGQVPTTPPTGTVTVLFQNKQCVAVLSGARGSCTVTNAIAGQDWKAVALYSGDENWRGTATSIEVTVNRRAGSGTTTPPPSPPPVTVIYPPAPAVITPPPTSNVIVTVIQNVNVNATPGADAGNTPQPAGQPMGQPSGQPAAVDASIARFNAPTGIARDKDGNVYISDSNNFTIRMIAPNGAVTTIAGTAGQKGDADGVGTAARFNAPGALAIDNAGNLFIIDNRNLRKVVLASGMVSTVVATPANSSGLTNTFVLPDSLAADAHGNVFVTDYLIGVVWKVDSIGQVMRFATISSGILNVAGSGPSGIAIDALNNLYITDLAYSPNAGGASAIRKIAPDGSVTTVVEASVGLVNAHGLAVDANGNFFVNENALIVKVNTDRTIATYKLPPSPAGGTVTAAGLTVEPAGQDIYFTDATKNTVNVLQEDGTIRVLAGSAGQAGSVDTEE